MPFGRIFQSQEALDSSDVTTFMALFISSSQNCFAVDNQINVLGADRKETYCHLQQQFWIFRLRIRVRLRATASYRKKLGYIVRVVSFINYYFSFTMHGIVSVSVRGYG